ncbi:hypothetical protein C8J56DRAFT_1092854 [Mycena floridula]|nr:hypothetical protein C8J56DRAFT_1092854 [Mycena floridula]
MRTSALTLTQQRKSWTSILLVTVLCPEFKIYLPFCLSSGQNNARVTGEALDGGFLYAAASPLSMFSSLGIVKASIIVLCASISPNSAQILSDAGFKFEGTLGKCPEERRRSRFVELLTQQHIEKSTKLSLTFQCSLWKTHLVVTTMILSILSFTPYIALINGRRSAQSVPVWVYLLLRIEAQTGPLPSIDDMTHSAEQWFQRAYVDTKGLYFDNRQFFKLEKDQILERVRCALQEGEWVERSPTTALTELVLYPSFVSGNEEAIFIMLKRRCTVYADLDLSDIMPLLPRLVDWPGVSLLRVPHDLDNRMERFTEDNPNIPIVSIEHSFNLQHNYKFFDRIRRLVERNRFTWALKTTTTRARLHISGVSSPDFRQRVPTWSLTPRGMPWSGWKLAAKLHLPIKANNIPGKNDPRGVLSSSNLCPSLLWSPQWMAADHSWASIYGELGFRGMIEFKFQRRDLGNYPERSNHRDQEDWSSSSSSYVYGTSYARI